MSDRQSIHSRLAPHFLKAFWSASLQWSSLLSQLCFSPAHLQLSQVRPNNAFKPNALRSTKHMAGIARSEEHTSELQSLLRSSYAVFCLKKKHTASKVVLFHSS